MGLTVITNHQPRHLLRFDELTKKEKENFDYDTSESEFVRYKGQVYDVFQEFQRVPYSNENRWFKSGYWDGILNDTFFSGVLIKFCDDYDSVILGRYFE